MKMCYRFLSIIVLILITLGNSCESHPKVNLKNVELGVRERKGIIILPVSGCGAELGETISILISIQEAFSDGFVVEARGSAIDRYLDEKKYQETSGNVDPKIINEISKLTTAPLAVSAHIASLDTINLIFISIIDIKEVQLIAGVYATFTAIKEIRDLLPELSKNLIDLCRKDYQNLPSLAVPTFIIPPEVNENDVLVLAQILAIEIANSGIIAVFPRRDLVGDVIIEELRKVQEETPEALNLGTTRKIDYILDSQVRSLESTNMFITRVLNINQGNVNVFDGTDRKYHNISDGLKKNLMREMAEDLKQKMAEKLMVTSFSNSAYRDSVQIANGGTEQNETTEQEEIAEPIVLIQKPIVEKPKQKPKADGETIGRKPTYPVAASLITIGGSVGTSFATPKIIGTLHGTFSPKPSQFLEIGLDIGLGSLREDVVDYNLLFPFIHYAGFVPFTENIGWYAGAGAGYMIAEYTFSNGKEPLNTFGYDFFTGFKIKDAFNISLTLRTTNFSLETTGVKVSAGYTHRFKHKEQRI
jgi:hypothetical protein